MNTHDKGYYDSNNELVLYEDNILSKQQASWTSSVNMKKIKSRKQKHKTQMGTLSIDHDHYRYSLEPPSVHRPGLQPANASDTEKKRSRRL